MKLIVGLGNPGAKYLLTRHNIGFMILDFFAESLSQTFSQKWKSEFTKTKFEGEDVVLLKPMTYMNLSGEAVRSCMDFFKVSPKDVTVLHDDIAIPFGALRFQTNRSAGGHNGIKDIIQKLSTQDFDRFKVGVGMPNGRQPVDKYVLSDFSKEEQSQLPDLLNDCEDALRFLIKNDLNKTASRFNRKAWPEENKEESV